MDRLVYAIFEDHESAQRTVDELMAHGVPDDVIDLVMHEGTIAEGDLAGPATEARRYGLFGGIVTATAGAVLGGVVGGGPGAALGLLMGGLLGGIVASVAGGSEPKPEISELVAEVRKGRVLLTIDLASKHVGLDCERFLEDHGALRVGMT